MKLTETALVTLFVCIDDFCKAKNLSFEHAFGRKSGLTLSEVWTIYALFQMSGTCDFMHFYEGLYGKYLKAFFPKMPSYSAFLRRVQICGSILGKILPELIESEGFFIIDSTPFSVCGEARHRHSRLFRGNVAWAFTSTKKIFGFKLHAVIDESGNVVKFCITNGSVSDSTAAMPLLQSLSGTAIGDKGYVGKSLRAELEKHGLKFIARARRNMKMQNTAEEKKLLSQRHRIETFFGKLKRRIGESFARFRSWRAALAAINVAIITMNFGF